MPVVLFTHEKIRKNKELMIGLTAIKWLLGSEDSPLGISMMTHRILSTKKYIYYFSHFDEKKKQTLTKATQGTGSLFDSQVDDVVCPGQAWQQE